MKFLSDVTSNALEADPYNALSPIPGFIEKLFVAKGDSVERGEALLVITAMKMEVCICMFLSNCDF